MPSRHPRLLFGALLLACAACDLIGGDEDSASHATDKCAKHRDCSDQEDAGAATFCTARSTCRELRSEDCVVAAGDETQANPVVIGSLFATSGTTSIDNLARQHAVQLAVEELAEGGGIPAPKAAAARNMLHVACDASRDPVRAAKHLMDIGALAIIGPAENRALTDVVAVTVPAGTLLFNPTALTTAADNAWDGDLGWSMAPTVEQRIPLLQAALSGMEAELRAQRGRPIKLGVLYRDDVYGRASFAAMQQLKFAGESLAPPGSHVRVDRYGADAAQRAALVSSYRVYAPDLLVLIDGADVVAELIEPIERSFQGVPVASAPHYLLREASKVSPLIGLMQRYSSLRERVRGIGTTPTEQSRPVFERFERRYEARFIDRGTKVPGAAASYDATFAIANAIAGSEVGEESSARVALALHGLSAAEPLVPVGAVKTSTALNVLAQGESVAGLGTMSPLRWDANGSTRAGALEVWCVGQQNQALYYGASGVTLDIATMALAGSFAPCKLSAPVGTDATPPPPQPPPPTAAGSEAPPPTAAGGAAPPPVTETAGQTGGVAGMSAPPPVATPTSEPVASPLPCGESTCAPERGEYCCITHTQSWRGSRTDFGCAVAADGASAPTCSQALFCASDKECPMGEVCCGDGSGARCTKALACTLSSGQHRECSTQRDCAAGARCCIGDSNSSTQCAPICSSYLGSHAVCEVVGDCPTTFLTECKPSAALPNVKACSGPGL